MSNYYNRKQDMDEALNLNVPAEFCKWTKWPGQLYRRGCDGSESINKGNFCSNCGKPIREVKT